MRRPRVVAAAMAVLLAGGIGLGVARASFGEASKRSPRSPARGALRPPVIHERFTLLSCDQATTIGMEGCYEHEVITLDRRIDNLVKAVFGLLYDDASRRRLVMAESTWLTYRAADCASQSDVYQGGSEAPVAAGLCLVAADRARIVGLTGFEEALRGTPS